MDLVNEYSGNTILFKGHVVILQFINEKEIRYNNNSFINWYACAF